MVKRIIVDLNEVSAGVFELACTIAQKVNGEVLGYVNIDVDKIKKSMGSVPLGGMSYAERVINLRTKEAEKEAEDVLNEFHEFFLSKQVKHEPLLHKGDLFRNLIEEGKTADLIITGIQTHKLSELLGTEKTLQNIFRISPCPILALPYNIAFQDVLIAYDGSLASARVMKSYVKLAGILPPVSRLVIMNVSDDEEDGMRILNPVVKYLAAYELSAEICVSPGDPKEVIHEKAFEMKSPLIVLGSVGNCFIKDLVWGSTTKHFIDEEAFALLTSH